MLYELRYENCWESLKLVILLSEEVDSLGIKGLASSSCKHSVVNTASVLWMVLQLETGGKR